MPFTIKTKITLGISLLFSLLLTISIVAIVFINLLSSETENLLTANYNTIKYCSEMLNALDDIGTKPDARVRFEQNLELQERNVTEPGEKAATQQLRAFFLQMAQGGRDTEIVHQINKQIYRIYILNQGALERKNNSALKTAENAKLWLSGMATLILLISFTLAMNLPGYIANPIKLLTEGIKAISQKNYEKKIYLHTNDEFGEMADAFNQMATKLYEYENSNISRLMFEKQRVETVINQMEDAVLGVDIEGKILFVNNMAASLFNLKAAEITGKAVANVAQHNDLLRAVMKKDPEQKPLKIIVEGKENYFSVSDKSVFNDQQAVIGEVYTLKNITTFKELDISKTNLLATISHELKTPISSIKMSAKLLNDARVGGLNTEQLELTQNIEEDAERLLKITGELLNMTQIETGNIQLKIQKVAVRDIVQNALQAVQMQLDNKHIVTDVKVNERISTVLADADKTAWVLINFLTNAIKYSPDHGKIELLVSSEGNSVEFSVRDQGPGIEEKYLTRVFDRYFTVPGVLDKSSTGLGLAISQEFIHAQGGQVKVESVFGNGATFSFMLPSQ